MNKKVKTKTKYDDKEDLKIRDVAHYQKSSQVLLLFVLIVLFGFTLFNSLIYINKYYRRKQDLKNGVETIEINNSKNTIIVTNDSKINKTIKEIVKKMLEVGETEDKIITYLGISKKEFERIKEFNGIH